MAKRTDPLAEYNAKRDFEKTPEPKGEAAKSEAAAAASARAQQVLAPERSAGGCRLANDS